MSNNLDLTFKPFTINVPQADLDDLSARLDRTRWPDALPDVGWSYGIPGDHLRELAEYWRHEYDWRAPEAQLNQWPQFLTTIDGAQVHFAHIRSSEPNAVPLLITHGWPGSIVEFTKIVGPLAEPRAHGADPAHAFHVVLPSIPGYGFSGPTRETGWDIHRVAAAFAKLMSRLGYSRYGVQGGDWGGFISREIGRTRPEVIGVHLNFLPAPITHEPTETELSLLSPTEAARVQASWERFRSRQLEDTAYYHLQSTRPQTLAYALTDSPVGQLAWIAEKFHAWAHEPVERDLLLTNTMIYWLTRTAGSSARLYYEHTHAAYSGQPPEPSTAPTAVASFSHETQLLIRSVAEQTNNIVQWTDYDHGGHFAALEHPRELVSDIRRFFASRT